MDHRGWCDTIRVISSIAIEQTEMRQNNSVDTIVSAVDDFVDHLHEQPELLRIGDSR